MAGPCAPCRPARPRGRSRRRRQNLFSNTPSTGLIPPGPGAPRRRLQPRRRAGRAGACRRSGPPDVAPQAMPMVPAGQVALALSARFGKDGPLIGGGLHWRVYAARRDAGGNYRLVKEEKAVPAPTLGAAGRQLHRACRLRAGHRGPAGDLAGPDRAAGVRSPGRRAANGRTGWRCPRARRTDFIRCLQRQPVRWRRTSADRRTGRDRRRADGAGGHVLHRVQLWRRQFLGAIGYPGAGRQAHRHHRDAPRGGYHAQAGRPSRAARRSPTPRGRC